MTNEMFYTRSHWQLMLICLMDNIVVWFCSLHSKPSQDMKVVLQRYVIVNYIIYYELLMIFLFLVQLMYAVS